MSIFFEDYSVKHALKREITELYISVAIKNFAVSMIALFEPIYLYDKLGLSLAEIMLYFAAVYTLYLFLLPIGGKICARFGFEHSILYSAPISVLYFSTLYFAGETRALIYFAPVFLAVYKALFWPAYHANFARYTSLGKRGKRISRLGALNALVIVAGPLLGGMLITLFGFNVLFIIVAVLILVSVIPLFTTQEVFKPSSFGYFHAFARLFKSYYRRYTLGFMGYAEELIKVTVWPIFIFVILKSYLSLGILSSMTIFLTAAFGLLIGRIVDKKGGRQILRFSTIGYSIVWFVRLAVQSTVGVFVVDGLSRLSGQGVGIPMQTLVYDKGTERGNLNFSVFFEMALVVGKMLIAWVLFFIFLYTQNVGIAFILGGVLSLLYLLLK